MKRAVISPEEIARQRRYEQQVLALRPGGKAYVMTYGCQQNVADSQQLKGMLAAMGFGFTEDPGQADLVLLNTCAIRDNAEQKVYGALGRLTHIKEKNPDLTVCLCGCMAQQERVAEKVRRSYRLVDLVFGPQALWKFPELLYEVLTKKSPVFSIENEQGAIAEGAPVIRDSAVKAWVSIMYGCNNFCSYCIVPYVRGRERSRAPEDILSEVEGLVRDGYKEITLLGQNVNSYGKDLDTPLDFAGLLERIDRIDGDFWLRFMTNHPKDTGDRLFSVMAESRHIAPQLHLPVQSGCDRVLKAMNRGYTRSGYLEKVRALREKIPNVVLTSDIIIGFPGEMEAEAMETVSLVEEVGYDALFTFIYSPRPGTPAAELPDPVSREEKQVWFERLLETQNRTSAARHAAYVGRRVPVLVDGCSGDGDWPLSARTPGGRLVHLQGPAEAVGQFAQAEITNSNTWALFGRL